MLTIRTYQPGDEAREVEFDRQIMASWPWPSACTEEGLARMISSPSFDPNHFIYAFDDDRLVGKAEIWFIRKSEDGTRSAFLQFPRTLPGFEKARQPLLDHVTRHLAEEGCGRIQIQGCTAWDGSVEWLFDHGYTIDPDKPLGFKKYLKYEMASGPINAPSGNVIELDMDVDREDIAHAASVWMRCSHESAIKHVEQLLKDQDTIAHLGVRESGEIAAVAHVAKNWYRPSTAALFYAYARTPRALRQLAAAVIDACIREGTADLIVDVINAHRCFEPTYLDLGFVEVAAHAMFEKVLA
ncbi:hypothetical protein ACFLSG_00555 [Candidatus Bipolaricaulota bacterium]